MPFAALLGFPDAVDHVEGIQKTGRHRHGPVDALTALLEALEHHSLAGQVDALRGKGHEVRANASLIRQPVSCRTVQNVRTGRSAFAAAAMKVWRSSAVR
jgi:hypothetical protein